MPKQLSRAGKSYHHGSLREEMVRIGLELVAEGGYQAIGIREITRRAGVTSAAAYRHFRDQDELRDKIALEIDQDLTRAMRESVEAQAVTTPVERLEAIGLAYFDYAMAHPKLFEYLNHGFSPNLTESVFDVLVDAVVEAARDRLGQEPDRAACTEQAIALWAAGHGICSLCSTGGLKDRPLPEKQHLQRVTMAHALAGLQHWLDTQQ